MWRACALALFVSALEVSFSAVSVASPDLKANCAVQLEDAGKQSPTHSMVNLCARILTEPVIENPLHVFTDTKTNEIKRRIVEQLGNPEVVPDSSSCDPEGIAKLATINGSDLTALLRALATIPDALPSGEIALQGFVVHGAVELSSIELPHALSISNAIFCGDIVLGSAVVDGPLRLSRVLLLGDAKTEGLFHGIDGVFSGGLSFDQVRGGLFIFPRAKIGTFSLTESSFGSLSLRKGILQELILQNSQQSSKIAERALSLVVSRFTKPEDDPLDPFSSRLVGNQIDLAESRTAGEFYADRLMADGVLSAFNARFDSVRLKASTLSAIDMREVTVHGDVDLSGASIGVGNGESKIGCVFKRADLLDVDAVIFRDAVIGGDLVMRAERPRQGVSGEKRVTSDRTICLNEVSIAGDLDLSGLEAPAIYLREGRIGGALRLADHFGNVPTLSETQNPMDFSFSKSGNILLENSWQFPARTRLRGAKFGALEILIRDGNLVRSAMASEEAAIMIDILDPLAFTVSGREPHRIFQRTFNALGRTEAIPILAFAEERRVTEASSWWRKPFRYLSLVLGGYGHRPIYTFLVAILATFIGAIVFVNTPEGRKLTWDQHQSLQNYRFWRVVDALNFSFDRLIPIVTIDKSHGDVRFTSSPWVRQYFVFHTVLGWLLTSAVVLVITESLGLRFGA